MSYVYEKVKQYDNLSRKYRIMITDKGNMVSLKGNEAIRIRMWADGESAPYVDDWLDEPWENGYPILIMTSRMLSKVGKVKYEFVIQEPGSPAVISTRQQNLLIQKSLIDYDGIIASEDFDVLSHLIGQATTIPDLINDINVSLDDVSNKISEVNYTMAEYERQMQTYATEYGEMKTNMQDVIDALHVYMENVENSAESSARLSESWAIGGTNSRDGEATNNSKFHSDQSKLYSDAAKVSADRAEEFAGRVDPKTLSQINAIDSNGLLGTKGAAVVSQDLVDEISTNIKEIHTSMLNIDTNVAVSTLQISDLQQNKADKNEVDALSNGKVDKNGFEQVTMEMLTSEVKTGMTGGSVAVVGTAVVGLKNLSTNIQDDIADFVTQAITISDYNYTITDNYAVLNSSTAWRHAILSVSAGERYKITLRTGGTSTPSIIYCKDNFFVNGTALFAGDGSSILYTDYELTIPMNTTKLILNSQIGTTIVAKKLNYKSIATKDEVENILIDTANIKNNAITVEKIGSAKINESYESGTIYSVTGEEASNAARIRTDFFTLPKGSIINTNPLISIGIFSYDITTKAYLSSILNGVITCTKYIAPNDMLIRIVLAWANLSKEITNPTDVSQHCEIYKTSDNVKSYVNPFIDSIQSDIDSIQSDIDSIQSDIGSNHTKTYDNANELIFSFTPNMPTSYLSDFCFVGEELWVFPVSNDEHTDTATVTRYLVDVENKTSVLQGSFTHNLGHCNSIDYCKETDCLIFGNGSGSYAQTGVIYIYPNASSLKNELNADINNAIAIDCASYNLGSKFNLCWGSSNSGRFDIAFLITDDNARIYKIQLGKGLNNLGKGVLLEGKSDSDFNGTFKIINDYTQDSLGYDNVNQGSDYDRGVLYTCVGHNGLWYWKNKLTTDGKIIREEVHEYYYKADGTLSNPACGGIALTDKYIFVGTGRINVLKR